MLRFLITIITWYAATIGAIASGILILEIIGYISAIAIIVVPVAIAMKQDEI